jgi:hypothetical protein
MQPAPRCPCGEKLESECMGCKDKHPITPHWRERDEATLPVHKELREPSVDDWAEDEE